MITPRLFRRLRAKWHHPQAYSVGFISAGLGEESRFAKAGSCWSDHLTNCYLEQDALAYSFSEIDQASLSVLGAGRLYDLSQDSLAKAFSKISFFDADPLCLPYWRKFANKYQQNCSCSYFVGDFSQVILYWYRGLLEEFSTLLKGQLPNLEDKWPLVLEAIEQIPQRDAIEAALDASSFLEKDSADAVISLNLISQIPIIWQKIVFRALAKYFPSSWIEKRKGSCLEAISIGASLLLRQHLRDLGISQARSILLIADLEYVNYRYQGPLKKKLSSTLPVIWSNRSGWLVNPEICGDRLGKDELEYEVSSPFWGLRFEPELISGKYFPSYNLISQNEWLWHLAPQGSDTKRRGIINRVIAMHLRT